MKGLSHVLLGLSLLSLAAGCESDTVDPSIPAEVSAYQKGDDSLFSDDEGWGDENPGVEDQEEPIGLEDEAQRVFAPELKAAQVCSTRPGHNPRLLHTTLRELQVRHYTHMLA